MSGVKVFPLRMDQKFHDEIGAALEKSVLKSKHEWILKAIKEKIEREAVTQ